MGSKLANGQCWLQSTCRGKLSYNVEERGPYFFISIINGAMRGFVYVLVYCKVCRLCTRLVIIKLMVIYQGKKCTFL